MIALNAKMKMYDGSKCQMKTNNGFEHQTETAALNAKWRNVVPVPKKDGKVRVCVDFRDLNKGNPKDDFPFSHIDMLVDNIASHSMLSFMDRFSKYSQVLMALEDMEKTSF
ncbi:Transposon Ty3-I Gag-Pol polyprotein [Vitis vinifera]|uniref:Transposon Ty3-I Gag-Pol polyprotein n=1 Tax=Vitis vinifera TaxID=29760 RepID=A0A438H0S2_VITVI|nr:Transposon Ty3-I Gag-Pol polyprotein [Vitis vinifera]